MTIVPEGVNMNVQLVVDVETCVGYGECVAEDPLAIALDDGGCARPLVAFLDKARAEGICDACPVGAISLCPAAEAA